MRKIFVLIMILLAATLALAEGTRTWQQSTFEELEKGTAKGIAIRSDGTLELAPSFKPVTTTPSTYIWALASDAQGNVYAAAGSPARVYQVTSSGQTSIIFEPKELQVQALVVDPTGAIFAATSPDGRVYRLQRRGPERKQAKPDATQSTPASSAQQAAERSPAALDPDWTSSVFFEPKTKYIWSLALANDGALYIATGDHGEIFRVDRTGQGGLFFKSDEAHIRALAIDGQGDLIAGSDGSGLVYRISPRGEAFVLYSAPKKEITALTVDRAGNIYAAGVGEKRGGGAPPVPTPGTIAMPIALQQQSGAQGSTNPNAAPTSGPGVPLPGMGAIGSEIYQIAPDGSPKRLWTSRDDVVYALALDQRGNLLAGSGNKAKVFSIISDERFTDLLKASATQVTAFAPAPNGGLYVSTSNLGKLFLLGATPDTEGSYQSDVFDAKIFSRWGRAEVRGSGAFELWARSGNVDNPDRNWSIWKQVDLTKDTPLAVPPARFVQWRAVLRPGLHPAQIESVALNFLPKNVAPKVDDVAVQVGSRYQGTPRTASANGTDSPAGRSDQLPPTTKDRDSIAVRWNTHDDNEDQLLYAIYYRGDGEQNWKLLQDRLIDRFYSFDAGLLPDGGYTIKVAASDAPSHSPEEALSDENESARFEVDTTPPQVQDLNAAIEGDQLHITFRAVDGFSDVRRAEFSVDAGEWQYVEPVGQLSDYRLENYDFNIPAPTAHVAQAFAQLNSSGVPTPQLKKRPKGSPGTSNNPTDEPLQQIVGEHLIVVRVYDKFDNVGVAKTIVHGK